MLTRIFSGLSLRRTVPRSLATGRQPLPMVSMGALAIPCLIVAILCQSCFFRKDSTQGADSGPGPRLSDYRLSRPPIALGPGVVNASGLTFNAERDSLFLIQNSPARVLEISRDGAVLRAIDLRGFEDTEDIAHLGGTRYAVIEERRRSVALIDITATTTAVDHAAVPTYLVEPEETGNKGLEGLTFNPLKGEYYVAREKRPRKIYRFHLSDTPGRVATNNPWNAQWRANGLSDLSAIHINADTGRLLLLSDESKAVVEVDSQGEELARLDIHGGKSGLSVDIPQPEGITMDRRKTLYICSEPNLLYIFTPTGG